MSDYWTNITNQRLTRRRAIAFSGGTAAAALFLAACGGNNSSSSSGSNNGASKSGLLTDPVDTTKSAKRGGTMKWFAPAEAANFDINNGLSPLNTPANLTSSLLVNEKPGLGKPPEYSEVVPDLAQSWEWSPDKLSLTMKVRSGIKWHNKAPVNGRAMDMDDILASWNRFAAKAQGRINLVNSVNPNAPVLSVTAPDSNTIVFKLKDPVVYLLSLLTPGQTGSFQMFPKEVDGTFDPRKDLIGTGAFYLDKYAASQGMTFKKNPDFWDIKNEPYVDVVEYPTVLEYAQQLAQLKAGNIYTLFGTTGSGLRSDDLIPVHKDEPNLQIYAVQPSGFNPGSALQFGMQPTEANKAFKDERVRQAFSMAHDRETYIDVFYGTTNFQKQGLPAQSYWFTSLGAAPGWRLDPKDAKTFGDNSKYFNYDVAEAKKLLAAAGYGAGLDIISSRIKGAELNTNGRDYQKQVEVREDMLRAIGVKTTPNLIDYTTEYVPKYITNAGKFDGILYRVGVASSNDPVVWTEWRYKANAADGWLGFDAAGKGDGSGDPAIEALITKARQEVDIDKRKGFVGDIQRQLAKSMYLISEPGVSDGFDLAWPALANHRAFQGDRRSQATSWWLDETKAPFKKA